MCFKIPLLLLWGFAPSCSSNFTTLSRSVLSNQISIDATQHLTYLELFKEVLQPISVNVPSQFTGRGQFSKDFFFPNIFFPMSTRYSPVKLVTPALRHYSMYCTTRNAMEIVINISMKMIFLKQVDSSEPNQFPSQVSFD